MRYITTSLFLLFMLVIIVCGIYPFALWCVGQLFFPFQANGSMLQDNNGKMIGSQLIAQAFTKDEYLQPRPSAAAYDAAASSSSALAASNPALRNRVTHALGPIVKYATGQLVGPDIEKWVHDNATDPKVIAQLQDFSKQNSGKTPSSADIQAMFFDMWRNANKDAKLQQIPADMVTTSASGLDPHITQQNAQLQMDRVITALAARLNLKQEDLRMEVQKILDTYTKAPMNELIGEPFVNVLQVNMELQRRYGVT